MSVYVCVFIMSVRERISETTRPIFIECLVCGHGSVLICGGVAISYVLPVLRMPSLHMARNRRHDERVYAHIGSKERHGYDSASTYNQTDPPGVAPN